MTKYRIRNCAVYERALHQKGDITAWFDEDAIDAWNEPSSGRPGRQRRYSDLAILKVLTLRTVFHPGLRQTEGFVSPLIGLMDLDLMIPTRAGWTTPCCPGGAASWMYRLPPRGPKVRSTS